MKFLHNKYPIYVPHLDLKEPFLKSRGAKSGDLDKLKILKQWDPTRFTNPAKFGYLYSPDNDNKEPFQFIVHTFSLEKLRMPNFLDSISTNSSLDKMDSLSTSVISDKHTHTYMPFGFILKVPKQNILIASREDLMFENNAGLIDRTDNLVNVFYKSKMKLRMV